MRIAALDLAGAAGRIETRFELPDGPPRGTALVCHPHPLYGGTMHNRVVHAAARALVGAGFATLRFHFRGVGLTAGVHDAGNGERDDARLALDRLAAAYPGLPLLAAGYSFGAWVALRAAATHPAVGLLVGIGVATRFHAYDEVLPAGKPVVVIQGSEDDLGPIAEVRALAARFARPARLVEVKGAGHLFESGVERVAEAIAAEAAALAAASGVT